MIILATCYWNGKTAPSPYLHKQLDVTLGVGSSLFQSKDEPGEEPERWWWRKLLSVWIRNQSSSRGGGNVESVPLLFGWPAVRCRRGYSAAQNDDAGKARAPAIRFSLG